MTTLTARDPKDLVAEHLAIIRGYVERMLTGRESLDASEDADADSRVSEFFAIGSSFKFTEREMVVLLFGGLFPPPRTSRCGCPTCSRRVRRG
jgi:hypothetical protein